MPPALPNTGTYKFQLSSGSLLDYLFICLLITINIQQGTQLRGITVGLIYRGTEMSRGHSGWGDLSWLALMGHAAQTRKQTARHWAPIMGWWHHPSLTPPAWHDPDGVSITQANCHVWRVGKSCKQGKDMSVFFFCLFFFFFYGRYSLWRSRLPWQCGWSSQLILFLFSLSAALVAIEDTPAGTAKRMTTYKKNAYCFLFFFAFW